MDRFKEDGTTTLVYPGPHLSDRGQRSLPVMNRLKALYRSWTIPCTGRDVYYTRHRKEWLGKIPEDQQFDMLQHLRQQARRELLSEAASMP